MVRKLILFSVLVSCVSFISTKVLPDSNQNLVPLSQIDGDPKKTDGLTSSEIDQRRSELEEELRRLDQSRRRRYDKDRRCCERSLDCTECEDRVQNSSCCQGASYSSCCQTAQHSSCCQTAPHSSCCQSAVSSCCQSAPPISCCRPVEQIPCCQRLQTQRCPYREEVRCGVPKVNTIRKRVNKVITVTDSPVNIQIIERHLVEKFDEDIKKFIEYEEQRVNNSIERHTLYLIEEFRLDEESEEKSLRENEAKLWKELNEKLENETIELIRSAKVSRQNLEILLQTERHNTTTARKLRHEQRRIQHQNDMKDLWKNELVRLNTTIHQRRIHFKHEIENIQNIRREGKPYDIVVGFDYDQVEVIPGTVETIKSQCCDRCENQNCGYQCAPQSCGYQTCAHHSCGYQACAHHSCGYQVCNHQSCGSQPCAHHSCGYQVCAHQSCGYQACAHHSCGYNDCSHSSHADCTVVKKKCDRCPCNHSFVSC